MKTKCIICGKEIESKEVNNAWPFVEHPEDGFAPCCPSCNNLVNQIRLMAFEAYGRDGNKWPSFIVHHNSEVTEKLRGHLGTELEKKSIEVFRVEAKKGDRE